MTSLNHGTTRRGSRRGGTIVLLALAAIAATSGCEQALQVAPSSSVLVLTAPVSAVGLNTTVTITATLTDSSGKAVVDGTLVTFSSSLGQLSPTEARVANGRAVTVLTSGTTSGTATVTAVSGGTSNSLAVRVGALPSRVTISGSTSGSVATIVATVYDSAGAPVPNAPVTFATSAGTLGYTAVVTDSLGRATTTLFGTYEAVVTAESFGMRAAMAINLSPTGTLSVNVAMSPVNPLRRQNITFTTTTTVPGNAPVFVQRYEWLFSDGLFVTTTGNTTARAFENEGVYWVTVRVFTSDGNVGMSRIEFYVD